MTRGFWRTTRQTLARIFLRRRYVGSDRIGNDYFLEGDKRQIDYNDRLPDPRTIPCQWNRWLRFQRQNIPSDPEIAREEQAKAEKQQRIDDIRQAEKTRREAEGDVVFVKGRPFTGIEHLIQVLEEERRREGSSKR